VKGLWAGWRPHDAGEPSSMEATTETLFVATPTLVLACPTPPSIRMGSQDHLKATPLFEGNFQILILDGALRRLHR